MFRVKHQLEEICQNFARIDCQDYIEQSQSEQSRKEGVVCVEWSSKGSALGENSRQDQVLEWRNDEDYARLPTQNDLLTVNNKRI